MSVLKKLGLLLLQVGADISKFMGFPFISQLFSAIPGKIGGEVRTVVGELNQFAGFVTLAEVAYPAIEGAKTGSQKLRFASPLIRKSIEIWAQDNLPGHNKLRAPVEKFQADVDAFSSAFVDILNDFGD